MGARRAGPLPLALGSWGTVASGAEVKSGGTSRQGTPRRSSRARTRTTDLPVNQAWQSDCTRRVEQTH